MTSQEALSREIIFELTRLTNFLLRVSRACESGEPSRAERVRNLAHQCRNVSSLVALPWTQDSTEMLMDVLNEVSGEMTTHRLPLKSRYLSELSFEVGRFQ